MIFNILRNKNRGHTNSEWMVQLILALTNRSIEYKLLGLERLLKGFRNILSVHYNYTNTL